MSDDRAPIRSFEEFWPYYLGEHRHPTSRLLHYFGTSGAVIGLISMIVGVVGFRWFPLLFVVGYGPAWVGHFVIEKNRPATFKHPFYSLAGDFKMLSLALSGKLDAELAKLGA